MRGFYRKGLFFLCIVYGTFGCVSAQTVSNATATQVGKTIHVSYDLDKEADVTLHLSTDGGNTYSEMHRVSGDVGKNVGAGHNTIVWDVLAEREQLVGDNIVLKVKAQGACPYTLTDYDGNTYRTVQIGEQCWMRENLRTTHYADGTSINHGTKGSQKYPYYFYPTDSRDSYYDKKYVSEYGLLYNWCAVMGYAKPSNANPSGVQGICPKGWHVPSAAEWEQLLKYVGSKREYVCGSGKDSIVKALADTVTWDSYACGAAAPPCYACKNPSSNNMTNFSIRAAGFYWTYHKILGKKQEPEMYPTRLCAQFWSTAQSHHSKDRISFHLDYDDCYLLYYQDRDMGYSVRCVKN